MKPKKKPLVEYGKPFVVYGKFEKAAGLTHIESWYGRARSMSVALRQAALMMWRRPSVSWKHYQLAVLSIQPLSDDEYQESLKKKGGKR